MRAGREVRRRTGWGVSWEGGRLGPKRERDGVGRDEGRDGEKGGEEGGGSRLRWGEMGGQFRDKSVG